MITFEDGLASTILAGGREKILVEKFVVALQQDRCGDTHFFVLLPGGTENFSAELLNSLLKVEKVGGILVRGIGAEHPVRPQVIFQCLDSGQKDIRVLSAPVIHQDAQRKAVPKAVSGVKFQKIDHFVYPAQARQQVAEIFSGMEGKSQAFSNLFNRLSIKFQNFHENWSPASNTFDIVRT